MGLGCGVMGLGENVVTKGHCEDSCVLDTVLCLDWIQNPTYVIKSRAHTHKLVHGKPKKCE